MLQGKCAYCLITLNSKNVGDYYDYLCISCEILFEETDVELAKNLGQEKKKSKDKKKK